MAYRITIIFNPEVVNKLRRTQQEITNLAGEIIPAALDAVQKRAVEHLSGVPFVSETGTHVIHKRTGKGAASVQAVYPYRTPYRGLIHASAMTRYANNPEEWDYLAILEYGRGSIKPKYTPSMQAGRINKARLTIPGGPYSLVHGLKGFRGKSGFYTFTKEIPAMEGKFWMRAAVQKAEPEMKAIANKAIEEFLQERGLN